MNQRAYKLVVLGASAGGLQAVSELLERLPPDFPLPIALVQHINKDPDNRLAQLLAQRCALPVKEAFDKETLQAGTVYVAPGDYHLLIERDFYCALSGDEAVSFSRPSIDVLFTSAADAVGEGLIAAVLTGANHDGAQGLADVARAGGYTMVQSVESAAFECMPRAALEKVSPDFQGSPAELGERLKKMVEE